MYVDSDRAADGKFHSESRWLNGMPAAKNILVTGGAGFIGGWFIRHMLQVHGDRYTLICFDKLDYCASTSNFTSIKRHHNFYFVKGDICNTLDVEEALRTYNIDAIVHFAAQSHVDKSLIDPISFSRTNVLGTQVLLETARRFNTIKRFIHVSTDEVYGENDDQDPVAFAENQGLCPTNPYSASKAAAEMIVQAYRKSFQMPLIIARCNNVFGPHQYPEKLIPKFITLLNQGKKMPIQGNGRNSRAFLWAGDAAEAFDVIFHKGSDGETYNISSEDRLQVLRVAQKILEYFDLCSAPRLEDWIEPVADRPFNDSMYWTDDSKLRALGWRQRTEFDDGLRQTVEWYCLHSDGFWSEAESNGV